jgi:hypothetical protein
LCPKRRPAQSREVTVIIVMFIEEIVVFTYIRISVIGDIVFILEKTLIDWLLALRKAVYRP